MKTHPTYSTLRRRALRLGTTFTALAAISTHALAGLVQPFTPGNLVVERLGDGSQALAATGNTLYFDEITPNGTLVQSIAIPNSGRDRAD